MGPPGLIPTTSGDVRLESFEYVMVLVSIVIGLALTHVLSALGAAVHRFRGHGSPIRLEAVYLLWVGFTLLRT